MKLYLLSEVAMLNDYQPLGVYTTREHGLWAFMERAEERRRYEDVFLLLEEFTADEISEPEGEALMVRGHLGSDEPIATVKRKNQRWAARFYTGWQQDWLEVIVPDSIQPAAESQWKLIAGLVRS